EFLAEEALHEISAGMPAAGGNLGGLETAIELVAGNLSNARPDGAGQDDALFVARDAVLEATIPVILYDADRFGAGGRNLDAEDVCTELLRRAEIHELDLLDHCSMSPV